MPRINGYYYLKIVLLFLIYFITARFGLKLNAVDGFAALVWPPTGISLAALLIFGFELWPAIALGAFFSNWSLGASVPIAISIAFGNTIEAVLGTFALKYFKIECSLTRLRDIFVLVVFAALFSTLFSATIGTVSLWISGVVLTKNFWTTWSTWWFGDVMGDLIFAPFFLVWSQVSKQKLKLKSFLYFSATALLITLASLFIFTNKFIPTDSSFPKPFFIFPILMLVALRFQQVGVVSSILIISSVVLWTTTLKTGRFWVGYLSESLFDAQIFLAILSISKLVLAAVISERQAAENTKRLLAEATVQSRDEFLSIASHELRTPLTSLLLQLEMLNRVLNKSLLEKAKYSNNIETISIPLKIAQIVTKSELQGKKITFLLDKLLDLTRIQQGTLQLQKEKTDFSKVVYDVVESFKPESASQIRVQIDPEVSGNWDPMRLEQIVSNLISNAIKYGEKNPIFVSLKKDSIHQKAVLSVYDQGMGIALELREKIFERFERGYFEKRKIPGLGLGLYITKQIVQAHHGNIRIESMPEKGSTFIIELPLG